MFSRKLIIYCLLWLYGVPAAVGPHWHHHYHCHPSNVGTGHAGDMHHGDACCDHDHHHFHASHPAAVGDVALESAGLISACENFAEDEHACAICAFYSQTATPLSESIIDLPLAVCWGLQQHAAPLSLVACEIWQARAPPAV